VRGKSERAIIRDLYRAVEPSESKCDCSPRSHEDTKKSEKTNVCKKLQLADIQSKTKLAGEGYEQSPLFYPRFV